MQSNICTHLYMCFPPFSSVNGLVHLLKKISDSSAANYVHRLVINCVSLLSGDDQAAYLSISFSFCRRGLTAVSETVTPWEQWEWRDGWIPVQKKQRGLKTKFSFIVSFLSHFNTGVDLRMMCFNLEIKCGICLLLSKAIKQNIQKKTRKICNHLSKVWLTWNGAGKTSSRRENILIIKADLT